MKKEDTTYQILVIEDNLGDYVILQEYLSEYLPNINAIHAENFKIAKEVLNSCENPFDIIFLDLTLPDKSGEELVLEIINLADESPVVVLTGRSDLEFGSRSLGWGVSDYLVKNDLSPIILYKSLIYNIQRTNFIKALKENERKYEDLFELNPSPILVLELETLKIMDVNQASIEKYGYSKEEFLTKSLNDICPNEDNEVLHQSINGVWTNIHQHFRKISQHITQSGELVDVKISPAKVTINNKNAVMVLVEDITENLNYFRKIEDQNKTFREIAWIQSHVVRAPLARLMGLMNIVETMELKEEDQELLEYIRQSADELDLIIRDISKKTEQI
jgi:PAS domain S-box-containing protein